MRNHLPLLLACATITSCLAAQTVPEALYYRFNEGSGVTTANVASPGVGTAIAPMIGLPFGAGKFSSGIVGNGANGTAQGVATGYNLALAGQSWTAEFWFLPNATAAGLQYLWGGSISGSLRCYTGSVSTAAPGNILIVGDGLPYTSMPGTVFPGVWMHLAYVFDNTAVPPVISVYLNGAFALSAPQPGALTLSSGTPMFVGSTGQANGGLNGTIDEFRLWTHARTAAEIAAGYNTELSNYNILAATTTGGGVGDLSLALSLISPGATEGFLLVSSTTNLPVGAGSFFGIEIDAVTFALLAEPLGVGDPLHYVVGPLGVFPDQPFNLGPGSLLLAGQTWDAVAVLVGPGFTYLGQSNVQRLVW